MGIQPGDLRILPLAGRDEVQRVEPEAETREFGQREKPARRGGKRRRARPPVHDPVDLALPCAADPGRATDASPPASSSSAPSGPHLDIRA
ncbi:MAG: hypothetical protein IT208_05245 [Chthonomonadales bacterium]|nr:hypothetical protein [Chthonomonadales bacterium]